MLGTDVWSSTYLDAEFVPLGIKFQIAQFKMLIEWVEELRSDFQDNFNFLICCIFGSNDKCYSFCEIKAIFWNLVILRNT